MSARSRTRQGNKKTAGVGNPVTSTRPSDTKSLKQGQGPGSNTNYRSDSSKSSLVTKSKPIPTSSARRAPSKVNWKAGRNTRIAGGAVYRVKEAPRKLTGKAPFQTGYSPRPESGAILLSQPDSGIQTPILKRSSAEFTVASAVNSPNGVVKAQSAQISALTLQLKSLAVQNSLPSPVDADVGSRGGAPVSSNASLYCVTPNNIDAATASSSDNDDHNNFSQDLLGTTYEVKINHDFVSSKVPAEASAKTEDPFASHKPTHDKMSSEDFEPIRYLGRGGFGTVVLVRQKTSGRLYAQKQLRKESLLVYKRGAECAKTERNVLESINRHPFMVKLYYAFQDEAKLYLLLEYAQGGELFQHLREERMLPEPTVSFYMAEMVLALEFLHTKVGVVYRDLKPENCLLDADGHLLLTDFGLCKEGMNDGERCNTLTGTTAYMAPEVIKGEDYGFPVDWWSLGAIGIDLLTGSPPFRGPNDKVVRDKIVKAKLTLPMYLSPDAKDILIRLLRKDPKQRLGSKMPEDLKKIKDHRFFRNVNWKKLAVRDAEPPIKPFITDPALAENFDAEFTTVPVTPSDEHFRSNIDELVYRSRNPSPNKKDAKKGNKGNCCGKSGTNTPTTPGETRRKEGLPCPLAPGAATAAGAGLVIDATADGETDDEVDEHLDDEEVDDDAVFDSNGIFGGFSFVARASVFEEAGFWIS